MFLGNLNGDVRWLFGWIGIDFREGLRWRNKIISIGMVLEIGCRRGYCCGWEKDVVLGLMFEVWCRRIKFIK